MSITPEPNRGLRLKLGRLSPIPTWHGGGNFWSHEFQLIVRSGSLAEFLPRAIEDDDSVLFEFRSGGSELASTSSAVGNLSEIPTKELNALRSAVEELKRKAEDPHCDRTKRRMIEAFRLPDPQTDRDLYRLIGKGSSAKLIVLWGVEREEGSALAPGAAVDLMHSPHSGGDGEANPRRRSIALPVLLILALLIGAGGWYYWQDQEKKRLAAEEAARVAAAEEAARIAAFNASANQSVPTVSPGSNGATNSVSPKSASPSSTATTAAASTTNAKGSTSEKGKGTTSTDAAPSATPTGTTPKSDSKPSASVPTKPALPGSGTVVRDRTGTVTGVVGKDGKIVPATPGTSLDKDGKVTSTTNGSILRDRTGNVTGVLGKDGKVVSATPGKVVDDPDGKLATGTPGTVVRNREGVVTGVFGSDGRVVAATPGTVIDRAGKIVTSRPGTVFRDGTGLVNGIVGTDGKIVDATPGVIGEDPFAADAKSSTDAGAPNSTTTPMTTKGAPPAGISSISIISTSLSPLLSDGNVEVLFNVVARNEAGVVVNAPPITGWKVNDQLQSKPDGTPANGPVIPMSLPPGTHRISTVGTGADGKPFQTDADVIVTPKT